MGLDMYAFSVPQGTGSDFELPKGVKREEVAYWRKFNALHGWMENLAWDKGFDGEFNCVPVLLTPADLDQLESDLKAKRLQPVAGFFFGEQTIYPEDVEATQEFITRARQCQESGHDVYYDSWW